MSKQRRPRAVGKVVTAGRIGAGALTFGFGAALLTGLAAPASAESTEAADSRGSAGGADAASSGRSGPSAGSRAAVDRAPAARLASRPAAEAASVQSVQAVQAVSSGTVSARSSQTRTSQTRTGQARTEPTVADAGANGVSAAARVGPSLATAVSMPAPDAPPISTSISTPVALAAAAQPSSAASEPEPAVAPAPRAETRRGNVLARAALAASPAALTAAPAMTASASVPSLLQGLFDLFCPTDPRGRLITIYKGTHFAIPNSFGFFIREVTGTGTFTSDTTYDLKDSDQFDWNKFTGIAFTPLEPDRDSAMVGWRYNLKTEEFEIAPFYNVDKVRILPTTPDIISVPADETFQYLVDYTGVTLTYGDQTVFKPYPEGLVPNVWTAARVSGWFGGNRVAPRTVSYYLRID